MIITEMLPITEYSSYGDWLTMQDEETRQLYFGVSGSQFVIESLMKRVLANTSNHFFLVAKDDNRWVGTVHIATSNHKSVELGIIVDEDYRGQGVATSMIDEAIIWATNRGYEDLYMHCLGRNHAIKHLCRKYGLETRNMLGDSQAEVKLVPANWITINKELYIKNRNIFHMFLQSGQKSIQKIYN